MDERIVDVMTNYTAPLAHDHIDRDAQRVHHDFHATIDHGSGLGRFARRGWKEAVKFWHLQGYLHERELRF